MFECVLIRHIDLFDIELILADPGAFDGQGPNTLARLEITGEPFGLTDLQEAFLLGQDEGHELGGGIPESTSKSDFRCWTALDSTSRSTAWSDTTRCSVRNCRFGLRCTALAEHLLAGGPLSSLDKAEAECAISRIQDFITHALIG